MTIRPISGSKPPSDVAADLRALANLAAADPFLSAVIERLFHTSVWPAHAADWRSGTVTDAFERAVAGVAALIEAEPSRTDTGGIYRADIALRAITIRLMGATPEAIAESKKELGW